MNGKRTRRLRISLGITRQWLCITVTPVPNSPVVHRQSPRLSAVRLTSLNGGTPAVGIASGAGRRIALALSLIALRRTLGAGSPLPGVKVGATPRPGLQPRRRPAPGRAK